MPELPLSMFFKLYRLPVGRRVHCMRKSGEQVKGERKLAGLVEACLRHDTALLETRTRFVEQRNMKSTWPVKVIELDQEHDHLLSSFHLVVQGMAGGPVGAPTTIAADKMRSTVFAGGLASLTQLDFVQEREQTQVWLTRLARESKEEIEVLGLKPIFDKLTAVTAEFGQLIDQNKPKATVTYEQLRDAEAQGHELMLRFVVAVCAMYDGEGPNDDADRARLLSPIVEQNEIVAEMYRKRAVTDVNPDTGDVVDPAVQPVGPLSPVVGPTDAPIGGGALPFINK